MFDVYKVFNFYPFLVCYYVMNDTIGLYETSERSNTLVAIQDCTLTSRMYLSVVTTIDNIFISCHFVKNMWRFFSAAAGIYHDHTTIHILLQRWWILVHKNDMHNLLIKLLPVIIIRNLWKNRCAEKSGTKQSNAARVKFLILKDFNYLLTTSYP